MEHSPFSATLSIKLYIPVCYIIVATFHAAMGAEASIIAIGVMTLLYSSRCPQLFIVTWLLYYRCTCNIPIKPTRVSNFISWCFIFYTKTSTVETKPGGRNYVILQVHLPLCQSIIIPRAASIINRYILTIFYRRNYWLLHSI